MRWQDWLIEALGDKPFPSIDADELKVRNAVRVFVRSMLVFRALREVDRTLAERIERIEQYHCEHEFSDERNGCFDSLFCSKCGALHPDWQRPKLGMALPDPEGAIWVKGECYWPKPKEEG